MSSFATEFPVKNIDNRAIFIAQLVAWLRGINNSIVLNEYSEADLNSDFVQIESRNGEELRVRELVGKLEFEAIGFRHDIVDDEGRLWRTEAVLKRENSEIDKSLLRVRTQCIAKHSWAKIDRPRKPYFIKNIIKDDFGGLDGQVYVKDGPILLDESDRALDFAHDILRGRASRYLPIVYVSAIREQQWAISDREIDKLAYDLGGMAHIVVEPSRAFSFKLRDVTDGNNAYGGAIAIAVPTAGIVRRINIGWRIQTSSDLLGYIRIAISEYCSEMPAKGWDWTELQESALRRLREQDRKRLSRSETEELYLAEIENLQDRIKQLEGQIFERPSKLVKDSDPDFISEYLSRIAGPETYPGEFLDRLIYAASEYNSMADQVGLDNRSKTIFAALSMHKKSSPGLELLREELRSATKEPKRVASDVETVMRRYGYQLKSDNKHRRLEPENTYQGLTNITLPKTPSDRRGLDNLRIQIETTLGIRKLK